MIARPLNSGLFEGLDWTQVTCSPSVNFHDLGQLSSVDVKNQDPATSVLVCNSLAPEEVVSVLVANPFQSLVQKRETHFLKDLSASGDFLLNPDHYFLGGGRRIADHIESEIEIRFSSTADKADLVTEVGAFIDQFGSQNVRESASAILEELYMNAMFDAPKEATSNGQKNCSYSGGNSSVMRLFKSEGRLVMTCEDPFGSLNLRKFIKRMDEVYKRGAGDAINLRGEGGAGLGCVIMFEHCEALYLGVVPGEKTLVSCVIPLGMSNRQRAQVKKSLHLVENIKTK